MPERSRFARRPLWLFARREADLYRVKEANGDARLLDARTMQPSQSLTHPSYPGVRLICTKRAGIYPARFAVEIDGKRLQMPSVCLSDAFDILAAWKRDPDVRKDVVEELVEPNIPTLPSDDTERPGVFLQDWERKDGFFRNAEKS